MNMEILLEEVKDSVEEARLTDLKDTEQVNVSLMNAYMYLRDNKSFMTKSLLHALIQKFEIAGGHFIDGFKEFSTSKVRIVGIS